MKQKKDQLKKFRIYNLRNGKIKQLGFCEKICLKIAGRVDGSRDLPKEDDVKCWTSPHLEKDIRSYDEFASYIWGHLQIEQEEEYSRLGELMDSVIHIKEQLKAAESDLDTAIKCEDAADVYRKHGEDNLTDAQIATRRANEKNKRLEPLRNQVSTFQVQLVSEINEFLKLRNKIIEDCNSTRMICHRAKDHIYQRFAVYWDSAMKKHSMSNNMPVVPFIEVSSRSEEIYMEPHKQLMQKAEMFIQTLVNNGKEIL